LGIRKQTGRATDEERALYEKLIRATDTTPPDLRAEASPATLWPPDHKLVRVLTTVRVSDADDPSPPVKLAVVVPHDQRKE